MSTPAGAEVIDVQFDVNGSEYQLQIEARETIADVLRDRLGLVGTRLSCELQVCGTCTVLLDGMPVSACSVLAVEADGRSLETVEGLSDPSGALHPLQAAFLATGAVQCGYCTPGMLLTAKALLERTPFPTRPEIRRYFNGNICRCTGYSAITEAIESASQAMKDQAPN
jgi:aerobic-type carbon monoxide dehydrogenase small subunit (CoxS/CutS family)